jgi:hypothetical protein
LYHEDGSVKGIATNDVGIAKNVIQNYESFYLYFIREHQKIPLKEEWKFTLK